MFNRTAPIIKLHAEATEDDHLELLGLLNSSTACFWMKQTCFEKGGGGEHWEWRYEHDGGKVSRFPISETKPLTLARQLDTLARQYSELLPEALVAAAAPTTERLAESRSQAAAIRGRMIALQEELDWRCYQLYGLLSDDLRYEGDNLPESAFSQRAFEIVMARQMDKGELETTWFERHGARPLTEIPSHWPSAYKKLVERRIKTIETNKEIALIEKPEYKRRWLQEPWQEQQQRALRNWLLDRLEETTKHTKNTKKEKKKMKTKRGLAFVRLLRNWRK